MEQKKSMIASLSFMVLVAIAILVAFSTLNKNIKLTVDGKTQEVETLTKTVAEFLYTEKIPLKEGYKIEPSIYSVLEDNMEITITNK